LRADRTFAWSSLFDVSRSTRRAALRGSQLESRTAGPRIDGTECIIYGCIIRKKRARQKSRCRSPYLADATVIRTRIRFASWCAQIRIDFRNPDATESPAASSNAAMRIHSAERFMHLVLLIRFCLRNKRTRHPIRDLRRRAARRSEFNLDHDPRGIAGDSYAIFEDTSGSPFFLIYRFCSDIYECSGSWAASLRQEITRCQRRLRN
jgi:hypothetical protein